MSEKVQQVMGLTLYGMYRQLKVELGVSGDNGNPDVDPLLEWGLTLPRGRLSSGPVKGCMYVSSDWIGSLGRL